MMKLREERGSTLVLVLLCMLIFMTMIIGFTFETRSQAVYSAGIKLHGFYRVAAEDVLNRVRSNLSPDFKKPDAGTDMRLWRFGSLLQGTGIEPTGTYGLLIQEGAVQQNSGLLNMTYKVWASNNPDDPANQLAGIDPVGNAAQFIQPNWDTDGKIVLTVEIYGPASTVFPVETVSHMIQPTGFELVEQHLDTTTEGNLYNATNAGTGSLDMEGNELDLSQDVNQNITVTP